MAHGLAILTVMAALIGAAMTASTPAAAHPARLRPFAGWIAGSIAAAALLAATLELLITPALRSLYAPLLAGLTGVLAAQAVGFLLRAHLGPPGQAALSALISLLAASAAWLLLTDAPPDVMARIGWGLLAGTLCGGAAFVGVARHTITRTPRVPRFLLGMGGVLLALSALSTMMHA